MVNLLRSASLAHLNVIIQDAGLSEATTLNNFLCTGCWLWFPDTQIDAVSLECIWCTRVAPDEGEEDETYEPNPLMD